MSSPPRYKPGKQKRGPAAYKSPPAAAEAPAKQRKRGPRTSEAVAPTWGQMLGATSASGNLEEDTGSVADTNSSEQPAKQDAPPRVERPTSRAKGDFEDVVYDAAEIEDAAAAPAAAAPAFTPHPPPAEVALEPQELEKWNCEACTFLNEACDCKCDVCGVVRPGSEKRVAEPGARALNSHSPTSSFDRSSFDQSWGTQTGPGTISTMSKRAAEDGGPPSETCRVVEDLCASDDSDVEFLGSSRGAFDGRRGGIQVLARWPDWFALPTDAVPGMKLNVPLYMIVTCPENARGGSQLLVQAPDGQHVQIVVPPHISPGMKFYAPMPEAYGKSQPMRTAPPMSNETRPAPPSRGRPPQ